jgi:hypothetical protein
LTPAQAHGAELTVTAAFGGATSEPAAVTVDATPASVDPTDGSALYGDAQPGSRIEVADGLGQTVCTATALGSMWTCQPGRPLADGETLHITVANAIGGHLENLTAEVIQDEIPAPLVQPSNGLAVRGLGLPGALIRVVFPGGATGQAQVGADGIWTVPLPFGYVPTDGAELSVTQTVPFNRAQIKTSAAATTVIDLVAPTAPTITPTDGTRLSGTGEAGTTVAVARADGTIPWTGTVAADGAWALDLSPAASVGEILVVTLADSAGNLSDPMPLRVGLIAVSPGSPTVGVGAEISFTVVNLQPGEPVTGAIRSDPASSAVLSADNNGSAQFTWSPPTGTAPGQHHFEATGAFSGTASAPFTVTAVVSPRDDEDDGGAGGGSGGSPSGGASTTTPATTAAATQTPLASVTPTATTVVSPRSAATTAAAKPLPTVTLPTPSLRPLSATGANSGLTTAAGWMAVAVLLGAAALVFATRRRAKGVTAGTGGE